jgi:hypothetical protein
MRRMKLATLLSGLMMLASTSLVSAQSTAYTTPFATSITYQNLGTQQAQVQFSFYNDDGAATQVNRTIAAGAGSSLFVGGLEAGEALPAGFKGSAVLSANQPIVATLVQIAQPSSGPNASPVKNRPLSNGFSSAAPNVLLATVLKNKFRTTSVFSVQNAEANTGIDLRIQLFNADNTAAPPIVINETNIPAGAAKYYDMGTLPQITAAEFNGSATVEAFRTGTQTPAQIVGSVMELSTNSLSAKAFEGITGGAGRIFMPSALCDAFSDKQRTAYAVQNNGDAATTVTVRYASGQQVSREILPGAKSSFVACDDGVPVGTSTAATIESSGEEIVVIGKVFAQPAIPGFETAFLGEATGADRLALPYVRWTSQANFESGARQRTFIAIQNVGAAAVSGVQVQYLNAQGTVVGTHTLGNIPAGGKANSTPPDAAADPNNPPIQLLEFGTPDGNPTGLGFGGSVIIQAPEGSSLIAVARVASRVGPTQVAEDYNGIDAN